MAEIKIGDKVVSRIDITGFSRYRDTGILKHRGESVPKGTLGRVVQINPYPIINVTTLTVDFEGYGLREVLEPVFREITLADNSPWVRKRKLTIDT
jgi:hypothetical protein